MNMRIDVELLEVHNRNECCWKRTKIIYKCINAEKKKTYNLSKKTHEPGITILLVA